MSSALSPASWLCWLFSCCMLWAEQAPELAVETTMQLLSCFCWLCSRLFHGHGLEQLWALCLLPCNSGREVTAGRVLLPLGHNLSQPHPGTACLDHAPDVVQSCTYVLKIPHFFHDVRSVQAATRNTQNFPKSILLHLILKVNNLIVLWFKNLPSRKH